MRFERGSRAGEGGMATNLMWSAALLGVDKKTLSLQALGSRSLLVSCSVSVVVIQ